jgi:hypothetical protein
MSFIRLRALTSPPTSSIMATRSPLPLDSKAMLQSLTQAAADLFIVNCTAGQGNVYFASPFDLFAAAAALTWVVYDVFLTIGSEVSPSLSCSWMMPD